MKDAVAVLTCTAPYWDDPSGVTFREGRMTDGRCPPDQHDVLSSVVWWSLGQEVR